MSTAETSSNQNPDAFMGEHYPYDYEMTHFGPAEHTLGRNAVRRELEFAYKTANIPLGEYDEEWATYDAEVHNAKMNVGLEITKDKLEFLSPAHTSRIAAELEKRQVTRFIMNSLEVEDTRGLLQKLKQIDLTDETERAKLINFLEWHNWVRAGEEKDIAEGLLPEHIRTMTARVEKAVEEGGLPPVMLEHQRFYADHSEMTRMWFDDIFETDPHGLASAVRKHNGRAYIRSVPEHSELREHVLAHENVHLWVGLTNRQHDATHYSQKYIQPPATTLYTIFPGEGSVYVEEGIVEQTTDGLLHGHFDIMDPQAPERADAKGYPGCRKLIDILGVPFYELAEAFASDDPEVAKRVAKKIDDKFPGMEVRQRIADLPLRSVGLETSASDQLAGELADAIRAEVKTRET